MSAPKRPSRIRERVVGCLQGGTKANNILPDEGFAVCTLGNSMIFFGGKALTNRVVVARPGGGHGYAVNLTDPPGNVWVNFRI